MLILSDQDQTFRIQKENIGVKHKKTGENTNFGFMIRIKCHRENFNLIWIWSRIQSKNAESV
jgi:hypothetical protein